MGNSVPLFKVFMPPEEILMPRLRDVLYSGQVSEGQPVQAFEAGFGAYVGSANVLSLYSGTAALHLALILAGVQPGDEVITTAMTAEPTNMAICHAGGKIVWADVDPRNGLLDPEAIRRRITARTRAVMVVHYGGLLANMAAINDLADEHALPVIEDAAHAMGAGYDGKPLGSRSDYTMYSLQAIKHLTTVDGGMLVCRDPEVMGKGRRVKWFGIDRQAPRTTVAVHEIGYKYHMNNVNATLGLVQLDYIHQLVARHKDNGRFFDRELAGVPGLEPACGDPRGDPSHWFYTVLAERRDDLSRCLAQAGIDSSTVHKRNDLHPVFAHSLAPLPGLDEYCRKVLHLPCGWWVTDEDRSRMVETIRKGW